MTLRGKPHLLDTLACLFFVFLVFPPSLDQILHQLEVPYLLTAVFLISFWLGILTFVLVGSSGDVVERTKGPGERSPWGDELCLKEKNNRREVVKVTITTWRKKCDCLEVVNYHIEGSFILPLALSSLPNFRVAGVQDGDQDVDHQDCHDDLVAHPDGDANRVGELE